MILEQMTSMSQLVGLFPCFIKGLFVMNILYRHSFSKKDVFLEWAKLKMIDINTYSIKLLIFIYICQE